MKALFHIGSSGRVPVPPEKRFLSSAMKRPNVVFILTDDQGYGDVGAHGNAWIKTPELDRLHHASIRFTDFHVGTTCAPTRAGLLTGHNCNSTGVWHTIGGRSLLRENEWTLAGALREAGYRTGHFGKWHLGDASPFRPHERGFDYSVAHWGGGIGNTADHWGNDYFDDTYSVNGQPVTFEGFCADVFFSEGLKFIERHTRSANAGQEADPFFCYIASNNPHSPWNVEKRYWEPYIDVAPGEQRARFYGTVANIDENVGKLRAKLEELGIAENTIVIFMTDNGSGGGVTCGPDGHVEEGPCNFNAGMRGVKCWEYEGGHRVPFFLYDPSSGAVGGCDIDTLTSYIDFMPTILDLCGVRVPENRTFHGRSLKPLMDGEHGGGWNERALVTDVQRVARPVKWQKSCVMKQRWRLINGRELYDLSTDPRQTVDIASDHADVVAELRSEYGKWWDLVSEQFNRDIPFHIGDTEEEVLLTTHDIRNEMCQGAWNQSQVRKGVVVAGYWEIDVRQAGRYRFEMRRWPREAGHELTHGFEGEDVEIRWDCIFERSQPAYRDGAALDIRWGRLEIGDQVLFAEVVPRAACVTFDVDLPEGQTHLYPSFHGFEPATIAPYYIYVKRQGGHMFNGLGMNLGNLSRISHAETRSISAENFTGEKGKGGMATEGTGATCARDLGQGWKVSPSISIPVGTTVDLADITGSGAIQSMWLAGTICRDLIIRIYWDDQETPSVECPWPDFFALHWNYVGVSVNSMPVSVNSKNGCHCFWEMPFRKRCRITMENMNPEKALVVYYQINYTLTDVPDDCACFHAQFRRVNPLPYKEVYTIVDGIKGQGHFVGTSMGWGINNNGWWGEGEIKFYIDGDGEFPTICGTGTEDYFGGSYNWDVEGQYKEYSTPFLGMHQVIRPDGTYQANHRHGMYRWHVMDPVRFRQDLKVTIQALGWRDGHRYLPGTHDICSTAFWYQPLPAAPFPTLPNRDALEII